MRRFLLPALLAILLPIGAGANTAEDQAAANRLAVEAARLASAAGTLQEPADQIDVLQRAVALLERIIRDYPGTDLAARLAAGVPFGTLTLPVLQGELRAAEQRACRVRATQICLMTQAIELAKLDHTGGYRWLFNEIVARRWPISDDNLSSLAAAQRIDNAVESSQLVLALAGDTDIQRRFLQSGRGWYRPFLGLAGQHLRLALTTGRDDDAEMARRFVMTDVQGAEQVTMLALLDAVTAAARRDSAGVRAAMARAEAALSVFGVVPFLLHRLPVFDEDGVRAILLARSGDVRGAVAAASSIARPGRRAFVLMIVSDVLGDSALATDAPRLLASDEQATEYLFHAAAMGGLPLTAQLVELAIQSAAADMRARPVAARLGAGLAGRVGRSDLLDQLLNTGAAEAEEVQLMYSTAAGDGQATASIIWPASQDRQLQPARLRLAIQSWLRWPR